MSLNDILVWSCSPKTTAHYHKTMLDVKKQTLNKCSEAFSFLLASAPTLRWALCRCWGFTGWWHVLFFYYYLYPGHKWKALLLSSTCCIMYRALQAACTHKYIVAKITRPELDSQTSLWRSEDQVKGSSTVEVSNSNSPHKDRSARVHMHAQKSYFDLPPFLEGLL